MPLQHVLMSLGNSVFPNIASRTSEIRIRDRSHKSVETVTATEKMFSQVLGDKPFSKPHNCHFRAEN